MRKALVSSIAVAVMLQAGMAFAADPPQMPSGPPGPGEFGAYYAHLTYSPDWDAPWRVADHPDVVVKFEDDAHRLVFWRGTSFIPCWVNDAGKWYTNEFVERRGHHSPNTEGSVEPMSDKQCRFSHVRVIESNDARVVVHWRYAPIDVRYEHPLTDLDTGWSDWVDEYYTIYPDAIGVRKITVHTNRPDLWMEFQESILLNQPGTLPEDNIEAAAVSLANMAGESVTYVWTEDGGPEFDRNPALSNIMKINLIGRLKPFAIVPPPKEGNLMTTYLGHGLNSKFNWWDHWPISQFASDRRGATSAARPSHSSLSHIGLPDTATAEWEPYEQEGKKVVKIMLNGLTDKAAEDLLPLARSWLNAPELSVDGNLECEGYDPTQMAYVLEGSGDATLKLDASADSPVVNPAFEINGWGDNGVAVKLNGRALEKGEDYRVGKRVTLGGTDLILWVKTEATEPMTLTLDAD